MSTTTTPTLADISDSLAYAVEYLAARAEVQPGEDAASVEAAKYALKALRTMAEGDEAHRWMADFKAKAARLVDSDDTITRCTAECLNACAGALVERNGFSLPYEDALDFALKMSADPERGGAHRSCLVELIARSYAAACVNAEGIEAPAADCPRDMLEQALGTLFMYAGDKCA